MTHAYFHSRWEEDMHAVPRFLWNAKMRFGKTFTAYQLARKLGAKRVLVVTFKPAVEDAWQTDLETMWISTAGSTCREISAAIPTKINRTEAARLFRLVPGSAGPRRGRKHQAEEPMDAQGEVGPRGLRRIPLRRMAGDRQGTVRGRGRGRRQEGSEARIRSRARRRERRPRRAFGERSRIPAHHDQSLPLPLRHTIQGASYGRVYRRADLQLDLH